jgi:hypothetical protein
MAPSAGPALFAKGVCLGACRLGGPAPDVLPPGASQGRCHAGPPRDKTCPATQLCCQGAHVVRAPVSPPLSLPLAASLPCGRVRAPKSCCPPGSSAAAQAKGGGSVCGEAGGLQAARPCRTPHPKKGAAKRMSQPLGQKLPPFARMLTRAGLARSHAQHPNTHLSRLESPTKGTGTARRAPHPRAHAWCTPLLPPWWHAAVAMARSQLRVSA